MIFKSLVKNIRSNFYKTLIIKMELSGKKVIFGLNLAIGPKQKTSRRPD